MFNTQFFINCSNICTIYNCHAEVLTYSFYSSFDKERSPIATIELLALVVAGLIARISLNIHIHQSISFRNILIDSVPSFLPTNRSTIYDPCCDSPPHDMAIIIHNYFMP